MKQWGHDELADDLAGSLYGMARMVWTNLQLGPSGSVRPDVLTINKSFGRPRPTAYECKISVADFRSDVTSGKWIAYQQYSHLVIFAAPAGLISKADVPSCCGLILRHENAWRIAKKAVVNPHPIPEEAWIKLLIDGVEREGPKARAKCWNDGDAVRKFAERFGAEAARYVADAASTHARIKAATEEVSRIMERAKKDAAGITSLATVQAPALWRELRAVLGLGETAGRWDVDAAIRELRTAREGTEERRVLRQLLFQLQGAVERHKQWMADEMDVTP